MSFALPASPAPVFEPLPIDGGQGLPQAFPFSFDGVLYRFRLYANVAAEELGDGAEIYALPTPGGAHMTVRVERQDPGGTAQTIFLRKVVPGVIYAVGPILLTLPDQRLSRLNLNGRGQAGSLLSGGIARRWA
jgi:hypothetical protein